MSEARDGGWGTPFLYIRLAEIEAIQGDVDNALQNIGRAVDRGYRDLPWLRNSPFFGDIQDNREMVRLQEFVQQHVESERAKISDQVAQSVHGAFLLDGDFRTNLVRIRIVRGSFIHYLG